MATRIQVCGTVAAELDGHRIEAELPGRQGRLLFVYLVLARRRASSRGELLEALWPQRMPSSAGSSLSALLSRLRRAVGAERLNGRAELRLELPPDAWVDVEAATEALHRAESAIARRDWTGAWGPARLAQHVAARGFLPGEDAAWIDEQRRRLEELQVRALELAGRACVEIGGAELDTAERSARTLIETAPYRESGHRLLMEALAARGNGAEALVVYERLRERLRDELGATPSQATKELHRRLLGGGA